MHDGAKPLASQSGTRLATPEAVPSRRVRARPTTAAIARLALRAWRSGDERRPDRLDAEPSRLFRSHLEVAARCRVGQPGAEPDDALDQANPPAHDGEGRGQQDLPLHPGAPITARAANPAHRGPGRNDTGVMH